MQAERSQSFEESVLQSLASIKAELADVRKEQDLSNVRIDTYQKASGQVVNLVFGLISTAVFAILVNLVVNRG
jgi:hypothetical protein